MNCRLPIYAFALCCLAAGVAFAQDSPEGADPADSADPADPAEGADSADPAEGADSADPAVYDLDEEDFAIDRRGERCIVTRNIRDTDILDERTILFRMRGGEYYVNYLRHDCRSLVREERFSYRSSGGRLCQVDTIRVLEQYGGIIQEGMSCGLGAFYPITEEEAEFLALEPEERRGRPAIRVTNPNADEEGEAADGEEAAE